MWVVERIRRRARRGAPQRQRRSEQVWTRQPPGSGTFYHPPQAPSIGTNPYSGIRVNVEAGHGTGSETAPSGYSPIGPLDSGSEVGADAEQICEDPTGGDVRSGAGSLHDQGVHVVAAGDEAHHVVGQVD